MAYEAASGARNEESPSARPERCHSETRRTRNRCERGTPRGRTTPRTSWKSVATRIRSFSNPPQRSCTLGRSSRQRARQDMVQEPDLSVREQPTKTIEKRVARTRAVSLGTEVRHSLGHPQAIALPEQGEEVFGMMGESREPTLRGSLPSRIAGTAAVVLSWTVVAREYQVASPARRAKFGKRVTSTSPGRVISEVTGSSSNRPSRQEPCGEPPPVRLRRPPSRVAREPRTARARWLPATPTA